MKYILFYSNFCQHSKELLLFLAKGDICKNEISYISIDNRVKIEDELFAKLETGKLVAVPKEIKCVPSLLKLHHNNSVVSGENVIKYFKSFVVKDKYMDEPVSYENTANYSDSFSYIDTSPEDLSAKGNGGSLIEHNYASLDHVDNIETPQESEDDNSTKNYDLGKIAEERNKILNKGIK
jgi:hypothetical protein